MYSQTPGSGLAPNNRGILDRPNSERVAFNYLLYLTRSQLRIFKLRRDCTDLFSVANLLLRNCLRESILRCACIVLNIIFILKGQIWDP